MTTIVAVDPGSSGAIALFGDAANGRVVAVEPFVDDELGIIAQVGRFAARALELCGSPRCIIERVHAMPGGGDRKMGATSAFAFGGAYRFARCCLLHTGLPFEDVPPQTWQKGLGLGKVAGPDRKRALKALAQERFRGQKVTLRTADALLLAEWAWLRWNASLASDTAGRVPTGADRC